MSRQFHGPRLAFAAVIVSSILAQGADTAPAGKATTSTTHTFRYTPPVFAPTVPVSVAVDFNGWTASTNPMVRGTDGVYTVTITVPPGLHHYKIVYDGKWIADPDDDKSLESDDGFNGKNSGFIASATAH